MAILLGGQREKNRQKEGILSAHMYMKNIGSTPRPRVPFLFILTHCYVLQNDPCDLLVPTDLDQTRSAASSYSG